MMRFILAVLLLFTCACGLTKQPEPEFPIRFELSVGASRRVPYAATLWFAQPDEEWREDTGRIVDVVRLEMECKGQQHGLTLARGEISNPVCGVRVKFVGFIGPKNDSATLPRAHFEITKE